MYEKLLEPINELKDKTNIKKINYFYTLVIDNQKVKVRKLSYL